MIYTLRKILSINHHVGEGRIVSCGFAGNQSYILIGYRGYEETHFYSKMVLHKISYISYKKDNKDFMFHIRSQIKHTRSCTVY